MTVNHQLPNGDIIEISPVDPDLPLFFDDGTPVTLKKKQEHGSKFEVVLPKGKNPRRDEATTPNYSMSFWYDAYGRYSGHESYPMYFRVVNEVSKFDAPAEEGDTANIRGYGDEVFEVRLIVGMKAAVTLKGSNLFVVNRNQLLKVGTDEPFVKEMSF
jgi:hypothetical protein